MKGILYGVGVGPGDPELLTLKAVHAIERCSVVAAPESGGSERLALRIARDHIGDKEVLLCSLPMTRDAQRLEQSRREAADLLCQRLEQGEDIAFLTLGDPSVYATWSYLHRLVAGAGYEVRVIPGITSFCAAAAALGEPLCEAEQPLHILPASCKSLEQCLEMEGVKVIMKMGKSRKQTLELLEEKGLLGRSALVERCTLPEEEIVPALERPDDGVGYFSLVIVREDA